MTPTDLREFSSVTRWLRSCSDADEHSGLLEDLADFCAYTGQTPEELVAGCLRETAAGTAISVKGRRLMHETIDAYVAERGLVGHAAVATGNRIRGFLVHNGVFIQGRVSR